jgi:hypothetical protein
LNLSINEINLDGSYYGLAGTMLVLLVLFYILGEQYQCNNKEPLTEPKRPVGLTDPFDVGVL